MKRKGFSLVELLVVITIIGVLSIVGLTIYNGVQNKARDVKKKKDIDAIATAYELRYSGVTRQYQPLEASDYTGSTDYFCLLNEKASAFKICAVLSDKTTYCRESARGTPPECVIP